MDKDIKSDELMKYNATKESIESVGWICSYGVWLWLGVCLLYIIVLLVN